MSLTIAYRPVARAEFDEATAWHERKKRGLGTRFVAAVQKVLDAITSNPQRYPVVFGDDVREGIVSRFSYCVYYRVKPGRIVVLAVFHTSRDPAIWQSRA